jgi:hypothetical protein
LEVRLRWKSIEFAGTGKALIIRTEAGPLRASLRGRAGERPIHAALEALEQHFPPSVATTPPSETWPVGFTSALDFIDFKAITPVRLQLLSGQMGVLTFCFLFLLEMGLAFGIAELGAPPAAASIILIALIGWPFLFAVWEVAIERGCHSMIVDRWRGRLRETFSPSMLKITTIGSPLTSQSFGMNVLASDHTLILPGLAAARNTVEEAGQALLAFSGTGSFEGHG